VLSNTLDDVASTLFKTQSTLCMILMVCIPLNRLMWLFCGGVLVGEGFQLWGSISSLVFESLGIPLRWNCFFGSCSKIKCRLVIIFFAIRVIVDIGVISCSFCRVLIKSTCHLFVTCPIFSQMCMKYSVG